MPGAITLQLHCLFSELFSFLCPVEILKMYLFILEKLNKLFLIGDIILMTLGKMVGIFLLPDFSLWAMVFFLLFLSSILSSAGSLRVHRLLDSCLFSLKNYTHVGRTVSAQKVIYILCSVVLCGFNIEVILSCLGHLPLFGNFFS